MTKKDEATLIRHKKFAKLASLIRRKKFAKLYHMSLAKVQEMVKLALKATRENTKACNGDPHQRITDKTDKNRCAEAWETDLARTTGELAKLVKKYGFTVDYNGLCPSLLYLDDEGRNQTAYIPF